MTPTYLRPHTNPGPPPVYGRDLGNPQLKRLLWRAGFGPRPGDIDALAGRPLTDVVQSLTRPQGPATLTGPEPQEDHAPIAPFDAWGHSHLWWLDRMVRSDQQLVERMTLIWHDWFATSSSKVGSAPLMIHQNQLFRSNALGSFRDLLMGVTRDPAMLIWLDGISNQKGAANENYARELLELFTLGAERMAYTEMDVRQLGLALTGWRADWVDGSGWENFRYDDSAHDHSVKRVFGGSGDYDWRDACTLALQSPFHPSFFVTKLWSYFVPTPPGAQTQAALEALYVDSGYGIRPVVEAILIHPDFHDGPAMVKPPVVYAAGMLRAMSRGVDTGAWYRLGETSGQLLFFPPDVGGWEDSAWLNTGMWRARFEMALYAIAPLDDWNGSVDPWKRAYDASEDAETAVARALDFFGNPVLTADTRGVLKAFAESCLPAVMSGTEPSFYRAMRQNALRQLVATCPDYQVS
jgi:uncharacterized protein (DUF1800 family)